eukprot:1608570-Amphidinium_carterae.1
MPKCGDQKLVAYGLEDIAGAINQHTMNVCCMRPWYKAAINVQCSDVQLAEKVATDDLAPPPHMVAFFMQHSALSSVAAKLTTRCGASRAH